MGVDVHWPEKPSTSAGWKIRQHTWTIVFHRQGEMKSKFIDLTCPAELKIEEVSTDRDDVTEIDDRSSWPPVHHIQLTVLPVLVMGMTKSSEIMSWVERRNIFQHRTHLLRAEEFFDWYEKKCSTINESIETSWTQIRIDKENSITRFCHLSFALGVKEKIQLWRSVVCSLHMVKLMTIQGEHLFISDRFPVQ